MKRGVLTLRTLLFLFLLCNLPHLSWAGVEDRKAIDDLLWIGKSDTVLTILRPQAENGDPEAQFWYCQLKSDWADFLPRASNLNAEQSRSYEFVYGLYFGQINLT